MTQLMENLRIPLEAIHDASPSLVDNTNTTNSDNFKQRKVDNLNRQPDFTVLWHNLTYMVDQRRWYHRVKERFLGRDTDNFETNDFVNNISNISLTRKGKRRILDQICGNVKSRQLTAILGPSGAGKSSLLHCLFQNRTVGTAGQILVDSPKMSKLRVCFIPQHDYLNECLTVREDLIFVSKLKLARVKGFLSNDSDEQSSPGSESYVRRVGEDSCTSLIDHEANALYVADLLSLGNCLDVTIKNISGGQKKRLSIARELMSKPDILILDEPTTGLDSLTCYKTVMVLKDLVRLSPNPMAVVVTIHQPQRAVFNMFDKTYFLSRDGRVIYDGDPKEVGPTLERVAQVKLPSANYNPASYLIELCSDESQRGILNCLSHHQQTEFYNQFDLSHIRALIRAKPGNSQSWKFCAVDDASSTMSEVSSQHPRMSPNFIDTSVKIIDQSSSEDGDDISSRYHISYQLRNCLSSHSTNLIQSFRHVFILTHRSWLSVIRNPSFTRSRFAFHTILPLLMLLVFGTSMGKPNSCPRLDTQLSISGLSGSINNGVAAQNIEETRFSLENISFFFILLYGFGINIISCTASFYPLTMHMFKKEMINGLYSSGPYFIGQMLAELPLEILFPFISILLSYPLTGQMSSYLEWRMFTVAFIVFLVSYAIHSLGLLAGSIFVNNVSVAVLLGQVTLLPFVLFSGFVIMPSRMPTWMRRSCYMSPFKHGLTAIMAARYGFDVCDCDEDMLPEEGSSGVAGLSSNVRHVLEYMFPNGVSGTNSSDSFPVTKIFDQMAERFTKASNSGLDIKTCDDVRPHLLHIFGVEDSDLFYSLAYLVLIIATIKLITYSIMKSFPYRIN